MDEMLTTVGVIGAALWGGRKVVGPYFDMVGKNLAEMGDWRRGNAIKIAEHARTFSEVNGTPDDSAVHPRIAERLVNSLSWIDDELMLRYSGGVLAAARSDGEDDDRAIRYLNLVSDMTRNETRLHFLLYRVLYESLQSTGGFNGAPAWRFRFEVPFTDVASSLFPRSTEMDEVDQYYALREALEGLGQHGLLNTGMMVLGASEERHNPDGTAAAEDVRLQINATELGVLLFLHARGASTSEYAALGSRTLAPFVPEEPLLTHATVAEKMI